MTLKEQLIKEIETTPISLLPEILHFVQSIKTKHPDVDFMEFAGMAADKYLSTINYTSKPLLRQTSAVISKQ